MKRKLCLLNVWINLYLVIYIKLTIRDALPILTEVKRVVNTSDTMQAIYCRPTLY